MAEFKTMCRQITNNELEFSKADFKHGSQFIKHCIHECYIYNSKILHLFM